MDTVVKDLNHERISRIEKAINILFTELEKTKEINKDLIRQTQTLSERSHTVYSYLFSKE